MDQSNIGAQFESVYDLIAHLGSSSCVNIGLLIWQVLGHRERFDKIAEQLARGENVVLLANHQTEADPAVSCPPPVDCNHGNNGC